MRLEGALLLASLNRTTFLAPLRLAFLVSPATGHTSWSFLRPVQLYLHSIPAPIGDVPNTAVPNFHIVGTITMPFFLSDSPWIPILNTLAVLIPPDAHGLVVHSVLALLFVLSACTVDRLIAWPSLRLFLWRFDIDISGRTQYDTCTHTENVITSWIVGSWWVSFWLVARLPVTLIIPNILYYPSRYNLFTPLTARGSGFVP